MNRKTFLATIAALFTAPFVGKSKPVPAETTITEQDLIDLVDSVSPAHRKGKLMIYVEGKPIAELTPYEMEYVSYVEPEIPKNWNANP